MGGHLATTLSRSVLVVLDSFCALYEAELEEKLVGKRTHFRTRGNRQRNRGYALEEVNHLSDKEFTAMFRMSRSSFGSLLSMIDPFMHDPDDRMATLSSGSVVSKATKLYATLRYLAGCFLHKCRYAIYCYPL
jgi:hypothetical protein